jgi:hypothetical protein
MRPDDMDSYPVNDLIVSTEDLPGQHMDVPVRHPHRQVKLDSKDSERLYQQLENDEERIKREHLTPPPLRINKTKLEQTQAWTKQDQERRSQQTSRSSGQQTIRPVQRAATAGTRRHISRDRHEADTFSYSDEDNNNIEQARASKETYRSAGNETIKPTRRVATNPSSSRHQSSTRYHFSHSDSSDEESRRHTQGSSSHTKHPAGAKDHREDSNERNPSDESFHFHSPKFRKALVTNPSASTIEPFEDHYAH